MDYIHIKNLEKYHPGYKDRHLIWCKSYFSMLNSDPIFEMLSEIDKWRFIAFIMLELQIKKLIPLDEDYLIRKGFNLKERPISKTIQMLHTLVEIRNETVTQNRIDIEKNRIDTEKEEDKETEPSAASLALKKIKNEGFNIYALINKLKEAIHQPKDWQFPDDVLLRVCAAYEQDKVKIKEPWPWFLKVMKAENFLWHANEQIKANKKDKQCAPSIKDVMKGIK
jgi:hypothetical protein